MINGLLVTLKDYKGIHPELDKAIDYLLSNDLNALPVGKTVISDKFNITKLVYIGKEEGKSFAEEHRYHYDLQIVLKGRELCYFDYLTDEVENHVQTPYNEDKDVIKYDVPLRHKVIMDSSSFTLFTPTDIHMPAQKIDEEEITKLVIKVRI